MKLGGEKWKATEELGDVYIFAGWLPSSMTREPFGIQP